MTDDGRTVVMCTHLLLEAEGLADQVVVLEDGTDLVDGHPDGAHRALLARTDRRARRRGPAAARPDRRRGRACSPTGAPAPVPASQLDDLDRLPDLVAALCADGVRLTRVEPHEPTLEDLYFAVRRQGAGTVGGPDTLEPITPSRVRTPPATPPQSDPFAGLQAPDAIDAADLEASE